MHYLEIVKNYAGIVFLVAAACFVAVSLWCDKRTPVEVRKPWDDLIP